MAGRHSYLFFLPLIFPVIGIVGCGSKAESTVSGRVTLDGEPLDHGDVTFASASGVGTVGAAGPIQSDGTYMVQAARTGGIPAGEYFVAVTSKGEPKPHPEGGPPTHGKDLIPRKYGYARKSGLRFEVKPGKNTIDLELTSEK